MTEQNRVHLSLRQVGQLATLLDGEGRRTLHLDTARGQLVIDITPIERQTDGVAMSKGSTTQILSAKTVGEFLTVHPCRSAPMVQVGDVVASGDLLGFIRIGALITPVTFDAESGRLATLVEVLAEERALVGYGVALFKVAPW